MKYILSSLNTTQNRMQAVKDAIEIAFRIDPRDIRYDSIPCLDKVVNSKSPADRNLILQERITQLLERLQNSVGARLELSNLTLGEKTEVSIKIGEQLVSYIL